MISKEIIFWLLEGDIAIQYQVQRDLLFSEKPELRKKIAERGWGKQFLDKRSPDGHWGRKFYQPKWTSTHYTLLDLRNLDIDPFQHLIQESVNKIAMQAKHPGQIHFEMEKQERKVVGIH